MLQEEIGGRTREFSILCCLVTMLFFCYYSIIMKLQDNKNDERTLRACSSVCGLPSAGHMCEKDNKTQEMK